MVVHCRKKMRCGFVVGNIYKEDIIDVISRYDPYKHDSMPAIIQGGISGLLAHAEKKGISVDTSEYCDICDVCHVVARQLNI